MRRALAMILLLVPVVSADSFVFDFEGPPPPPGTSITVFDSNGSGASMTISWSAVLEIDNLSLFPGVPPTWGMGSLAVFGGLDPFVVTFDGLTGGIPYEMSWEIGDFGPSDTDEFNVTTLPSGNNNTGLLDGSLPGFNTRTLTIVDMMGITGFGPGLPSVVFGQTGGHSLYYDNFVVTTATVAPSTDVPMGGFGGSGETGTGGATGQFPSTTVPEPAMVVLLGLGFAAAALRRRR